MTSSRRTDVLVVAAHAPELRGIRQALGERLEGTVRGLHVTAKAVGLGLATAGAFAAKRLVQLEPRVVVLLGTAGAYPSAADDRPGDVLVARRIQLFDAGVCASVASFPEPMLTESIPHALVASGLVSTGGRVRLAAIASPLARTVDDATAAGARAAGHEAECLEAMAVAQAAAMTATPFAVVLALTHRVGSQWQTDARTHERTATHAVAETLLRWLHAGAPGLPHDHP